MTLTEYLLQFMLSAGAEWVFWLLIALSVVSIALMIERAFVLVASRSDLGRLQHSLSGLLTGTPVKQVIEEVGSLKGIEASVLRQGLERANHGTETMEEVVAGLMGLERMKLERGIAFLGTIGSNAPFIGLLGTVLGIVRSFHDLGKNLSGGAEVVMGGISEALVATAVGLMVAIPAVMAYNYFLRLIKQRMAHLTALAHLAIAGVKAQSSRHGA